MKQFYLKLKEIGDYLNSIIKIFIFLMLAAMTIIITAQIICRVFFTALSWTEELSRYLLVWGSLLAATIAYKQGSHIAINFIVEKLKDKRRKTITIFTNIMTIIFFLIGINYGIKMISLQIFQTSPALLIPMKIIYLCLPLSFSIMLYYGIVNLLGELTGYKEMKKS
ncbi:MAG: TRAP transporter small permease [Candidatus Caldatribacteriota bacterium]|nr:TRAP transporter small permease [Candidatus Caldatribacteriota bacterium]